MSHVDRGDPGRLGWENLRALGRAARRTRRAEDRTSEPPKRRRGRLSREFSQPRRPKEVPRSRERKLGGAFRSLVFDREVDHLRRLRSGFAPDRSDGGCVNTFGR